MKAYGQIAIANVKDGNSFLSFTTNYSYAQTDINKYGTRGYSSTWGVNEDVSSVFIGDTVILTVKNTTKNVYTSIVAKVTGINVTQKLLTCTTQFFVESGSAGIKGDAGTSVSGISPEYVATASNSTVPTSGFSSTQPTWTSAKPYLWTRYKVTYSNGSTSYTTAYCDSSWQAVNEIQVGGRNLLTNSNFSKIEAITGTMNSYGLYTRGSTYTCSIDSSVKYNNHNTLKIVSNKSGNTSGEDILWRAMPIGSKVVMFSGDEEYVLSFWAKAEKDITYRVRWGYGDYTNYNPRFTTEWKKHIIPLPTTSDFDNDLIMVFLEAVTCWMTDFKLEKGNLATDWTPAPEDFNQQILDTKEEITQQVSSDFKVNNESILGTVSEKYSTKQELQLTNNKFVNYSTTTEMNAAIKAKADAIETSVSKVTETVNSLSVGGRNLFKYSQRNKCNYVSGTIEENGCETIYKCNKSGGWAIIPVSNPTPLVPANTDFVVSFDVRNTNGFGFELTATSNSSTRVQGKQEIVNNSSEWKRVSYCLNTGSVTDLGGINLWGVGEVRHIKFELGNKPTDWTPAIEDTEAQISAVSTIATQTAEKFNWLVKSGTSSSNFELTDRTATLIAKQINLNGLVSFNGLDSSTRQKITDASSTASSAKQAADSASSTASSASSVASEAKKTADSASSTASSANSTANQAKSTADSAKTIANSIPFSQGKLLFADPSFKWSSNSTMTYNNRGNGTVTVTRSAKSSDNPIADTNYELVIKNTGSATPGIGGFCWAHASRANAVFVYRIIAKIPTGRNFEFTTNAIGDNHTRRWLTPHLGTGKYEEYIFKVICGSSGNFSSTGFFYIEGSDGSTSNPVTWYVAYAAVYDMTQQNEAESWVINNGTNIANWCAQNNKTLIDGAKIYTGSIAALQIASNAITAEKIATGAVTASKISVNSLEAIVAKIGGFNIGSTYLANNTTSLGGSANSVYVGTNGISCGTAFKVTNSGALTASNVDVSGKISATSGSIGGWTIASSNLYNGNWGLDNSVMLCTGSSASKSIGGSANINGWTITSGSKFGVTKNGDVYASNINATGGKIGGWTINSDSLISDTTKKYTDAHGSVLSNFASTFSDSELTFSYIEDGVERYAGLSPTGLTML